MTKCVAKKWKKFEKKLEKEKFLKKNSAAVEKSEENTDESAKGSG